MTKQHETREQWLQAAAEALRPVMAEATGLTVPAVRIGVGWSSKGARSTVAGQCWATTASADGIAEVTVRVNITDPVTLAAVLCHELIHAALNCEGGHAGAFKRAHTALGFTGSAKACTPGDDFKATLAALTAGLGDYPAPGFTGGGNSGPKKQTTRMIKVQCIDCGFTFRTTRQWIEQAEGDLQCPDRNCGGEAGEAE